MSGSPSSTGGRWSPRPPQRSNSGHSDSTASHYVNAEGPSTLHRDGSFRSDAAGPSSHGDTLQVAGASSVPMAQSSSMPGAHPSAGLERQRSDGERGLRGGRDGAGTSVNVERPTGPLRTVSSIAAISGTTDTFTSPSANDQPGRLSSSSQNRGEGSFGEGGPTPRRRQDMDRVKSRAVDPGWDWESQRDRSEVGAVPSHPGSPSRGSNASSRDAMLGARSRQPPRIDTGGSSRPSESSSSGRGPPGGDLYRGNDASPAPSPSHTHAPQTFPSSRGDKSGDKSQASTPINQSSSRRDQMCAACGKPMTGQFVRALGTVYHLDCFRCNDCGKVVAAKFFPATDDMIDSVGTGKLFPLCETDYFKRLDLICAKCGGALRGSYITALGMKFHVEHFTCSICPTVFGPQDSYYEHDGRVFCHFHYSTRFAIKCTGCRTAILKQFVEINRNNQDEHWHPECYMIHKFWNIKLCPTGTTPKQSVALEPTTAAAPEPSNSGVAPVTAALATDEPSAEALEIEENETPSSLKQKQKQMEEQVYRIWTVLSAFEESSAACISEMLRHVSSGRYLGGVRMAEKFILHVEILFSAIDDLEKQFRKEQSKGISHIREARMLCKKIVNFFSLLSHTQETGARRMGITQELLSLVTGLAHYLKILIRIALTGALKLDRDYSNRQAIGWFLSQLAYLAREGGTSSAEENSPVSAGGSNQGNGAYGYRSLPRSTSSGASEGGETATDLCVACGQTVEEECLRMGVNMRWHSSCLRCSNCQRPAAKEPGSSKRAIEQENASSSGTPPLPASQFSLDVSRRQYDPSMPNGGTRYQQSMHAVIYSTYCPDHTVAKAKLGFEHVTRLEQYAFLLRVALNRLFALLRKRGVVPPSPPVAKSDLPSDSTDSEGTTEELPMHEAYRDSQDIKRMKSVNLDRKLSTKARVPHISTVVGSPSGRQTQASDPQKASPTDTSGSATLPGQQSSPVPRQPSPDALSQTRKSTSPGRKPLPSSRDASPNRQLQQRVAQRAGSPGAQEPGAIVPIRPPFARHNTDVRIRDEGPVRQLSGDEMKQQSVQSEDGITLADIPQLLEAEQAREQHRSLPHEGGRCMSELSALELFIVKHMAVMTLQQSALKDMVPLDDLIEFIETRKNTFWGKLFKGGKDKKEIKKKGVFGIPLDILVERNGADSTLGASATHLRVPSFIDDIISAMKQMDMSVEGIFRKNGNIRRLKELSEALDRDSSAVNLLDDNPVQLAALLKKFLRELPDPLMTFKLHRLFVMSQRLDTEMERRRILHLVTVLLPKGHRDTMEVLFVFLKWVASFSHVDEETGSKMDLQNLSTVICPNILYAKGTDPTKDETFLANRAVSCLLEHQDGFWTVPPELETVLHDRELLASSAEMTSRDILKRCEKYAKRQRAGTVGSRPSGPPSSGPGSGSGIGGGSRMGDMSSRGETSRGEMSNRHWPDLQVPHGVRPGGGDSNGIARGQMRTPDGGGGGGVAAGGAGGGGPGGAGNGENRMSWKPNGPGQYPPHAQHQHQYQQQHQQQQGQIQGQQMQHQHPQQMQQMQSPYSSNSQNSGPGQWQGPRPPPGPGPGSGLGAGPGPGQGQVQGRATPHGSERDLSNGNNNNEQRPPPSMPSQVPVEQRSS